MIGRNRRPSGHRGRDDALARVAVGRVPPALRMDEAERPVHLRNLGIHDARGIRELERTAREYRLYALDRTMPPKPGLVREPGFEGPGIEVEVWAVPEEKFASGPTTTPPGSGVA